ncbi:MAG TPA: hypothetical protein VIV60_29280, partial [Polyangiaceae bacterium]
DRDRIVARLHTHCFGDQVEGLVTCDRCGQPFEMRFSLAEEVLEPLAKQRASVPQAESREHGIYRLPDGQRFRLPTVGDERELEGLPSERIAAGFTRRCLVSDDDSMKNPSEAIAVELDQSMSALCPVLDLEVPVSCPDCHATQQVRFDIVSYFISCLARERPILLREVHSLAVTYHWSWDEIVKLPRSLRRSHVELIEVDRGRLRGAS